MPTITASRQRLRTSTEALYNPHQFAVPITRFHPYEAPDIFATIGHMRTAASYGSLFLPLWGL